MAAFKVSFSPRSQEPLLSMKNSLTPLLALSLAFCLKTPAFAGEPAPVASEIAGFAAFDVAAPSEPGKEQISLKAIGLLQPIEYEGTAITLRGKTLTDKDSVWTENQFNPPKATIATATHYLEVTSGPLQGALFDIVRTDAVSHTLTIGQVLSKSAGPNPGFRVRRHWTLGSLFGVANEAGLLAGDETTADLIAIYNGKKYDQYFYSNVVGSTGWRRVGAQTLDAAGRQIYPDDGLAITRRGTSGVSFLVTGVLRTERSMIPVNKGFNLLANEYQVPLTLATSQLYTGSPSSGLRAGESAALADNVLIYNGAGYDTYYYQKSVRNASGWRALNDVHTDAGATPIPIGSAFAIQRRGSIGFTWLAPAPAAGAPSGF
jgi:uncharacterized protein (TIGR02597 family)